MATIRAFRALRPVPELACSVACVPYDVLDDAEVNEFTRDNPLSFLRVTRPEAELDDSEKNSPVLAFERARQNLKRLIDDGVLINDRETSLYAYRLAAATHEQTGVVACCSLDEYERGDIRRHENTRPDKVQNRTGHLLTLRAQTGLILLAYRGTETIRSLTDKATESEPLYSFHAVDRVEHTIWRIDDVEPWVEAFRSIERLYIADGHHRIESAELARKRIMSGGGNLPSGDEYNFVVAGIFPAEDLRILPYNRAVVNLNGTAETDIVETLKAKFRVSETDQKAPERHDEFCMYMRGKWLKLEYRGDRAGSDVIEKLDVSILQNNVLAPLFHITDPRTDERIMFVGGGRGTKELERLVDNGEAAVAFSLFPTTMDDLFAVSDAGEIMPPKSTWFEPKLKDGLLIHQI